MKRLVIPTILCVLLVVCIKPKRDNEYDPNNPNKVYLEGKVRGFDDLPVVNARVVLASDESDTVEQFTNTEGWYGFEEVNPGVYTLIAQGAYYYFECYPESLAAGAEDTFDIYFSTAFWDFENEPLGTQEPRGFQTRIGSWSIIDDPDQGHVYNGVTPGTGIAVAINDLMLDDFYYESMFKVDPVSGPGFYTGLVFRFQDDLNYYLVFCSSSDMALIEVFSGGWHTIDVTTRPFALDTWYLLAVDCSGSRIQVYVDNATTPVFDVTHNTFLSGNVGLFAEHNTDVSFDDIYIDITE